MDNKEFNEFLMHNKSKINEITLNNPPIKKEDEWSDKKYDFFDENVKGYVELDTDKSGVDEFEESWMEEADN